MQFKRNGNGFFNRFADIKRTARFTIEEDERINWLTDMLKPSMRLWMGKDWVEFPLGVFVLSTPVRICATAGCITRFLPMTKA